MTAPTQSSEAVPVAAPVTAPASVQPQSSKPVPFSVTKKANIAGQPQEDITVVTFNDQNGHELSIEIKRVGDSFEITETVEVDSEEQIKENQEALERSTVHMLSTIANRQVVFERQIQSLHQIIENQSKQLLFIKKVTMALATGTSKDYKQYIKREQSSDAKAAHATSLEKNAQHEREQEQRIQAVAQMFEMLGVNGMSNDDLIIEIDLQ